MSSCTIQSVDQMRACVADWRRQGLRVGLVPTMGDLHPGHLALVRATRAEADKVVTSIFVNPLQFGEGEDFDRYPRTLDADMAALEAAGNDAVFAPTMEAVYPEGHPVATRVVVQGLSTILCGYRRPKHFEGVATVVNLLLNLIHPDVVAFGMKDYQQLCVIQRMVSDLQMPVKVLGVPTVREPSGLAISSRNRYLSDAERETAPILRTTLQTLAKALSAGDREYEALETAAADSLIAAGFQPDYVAIRDPQSLGAPAADARQWVVMAAAWLGAARLIDNTLVGEVP